MSNYFNDAQKEAFRTGDYWCPHCEIILMEFEDEETRDTLVCPVCGHRCSIDNYGMTEDEVWDRDHPDDEEYLKRYLL